MAGRAYSKGKHQMAMSRATQARYHDCRTRVATGRPRADSSPPTAIWSVPGEITAFLSDLWTDTHVAGVVRSAVWLAYSGAAVRRHGHRSVAARRLPLTPRWVARRIARVVPIATLASPEVLMRRAGAR